MNATASNPSSDSAEAPVSEPPARPEPAELPETTALNAAWSRMKAAWSTDRGLPYKQRMSLLKALGKQVRARREAISAAISADFGNRSTAETELGEIWVVLEEIKHARLHLADWMEPVEAEIGWTLKPASGRTELQPLGVVGIISPWNYPLQLALAPLVAAIAAGNRVLLKTSEYTPKTSALLKELVAAVFPPEVCAVVEGDARVGAAFSALPFDHLLFTGSTSVGRLVMQAAAKNLTPVTLELGGKSPCIVHPSFSIAKAAERIVWGKTYNSGQTCIAPDYVLVPKDKVEDFVAAARVAFSKMYPSIDGNADYTSIVSDRHHKRLHQLVDAAAEAGARVETLGEDAPDSRRMALRLVVNPDPSLTVMQDEIFGPVLPVIGVDDVDAAVAFVNERPRPLALYYFDHGRRRQRQVLDATHSGGVCLNDCLLHVTQATLPFGGVGPSGMGAYHGHHGFLAFSHQRAVLKQPRINAVSILNPPYGGLMKWFTKLVTAL
jgi:coniferyl-aldehyde dehydrogenase